MHLKTVYFLNIAEELLIILTVNLAIKKENIGKISAKTVSELI